MGMKSFSGAMNRMGIDLGSSQVRIYIGNKMALSETSVAAISLSDGTAAAFGVNAELFYHREPDRYRLERPVKNGVIADYYLAKDMLRYFMEKALRRTVSRPSVMLAVPGGTSSVVRHALVDAAMHAGAQHVFLIEAAAAAALGAGWKLSLPETVLSLVIGQDICDCGLFSCGGVVTAGAVPFGGRDIDEGIRTYMLETYHMMIGMQPAEAIKKEMAAAALPETPRSFRVRGRRAEDGVEVVIELSDEELVPVIQRLLAPAVRLLKKTMRRAEPEMAEDLLRRGMVLSGGTALLCGVGDWLAAETGIPVLVPEDAENVTARGCYEALGEYARLPGIVENGAAYDPVKFS